MKDEATAANIFRRTGGAREPTDQKPYNGKAQIPGAQACFFRRVTGRRSVLRRWHAPLVRAATRSILPRMGGCCSHARRRGVITRRLPQRVPFAPLWRVLIRSWGMVLPRRSVSGLPTLPVRRRSWRNPRWAPARVRPHAPPLRGLAYVRSQAPSLQLGSRRPQKALRVRGFVTSCAARWALRPAACSPPAGFGIV